MVVKVAINGYGTVGRRVADAVALQKDMEVIGVVKTRPTFEATHATNKGYKLFADCRESCKTFEEAGMKTEGTVDDVIREADIIVDTCPDGIGIENKDKHYLKSGMKAIFQGGEDSAIGEVSFNANANYKKALGKDFVRVVSCNTTALCRTVGAMDGKYGVKKARVVLIRRGPDPANIKKGPVNAIVPDPVTVPSHHGPDVKTVIPDLNIVTVAVKVPTTLMHMHTVNLELAKKASAQDIIDTWNRTPRIMPVKAKEGLKSTAQIMDFAKDLGRPRSDINEIVVWEESLHADGEVFFMQAIHQESDIVPDNVDAIRAMMEIETDPLTSIRKTDSAMGLKKWW